MNPSPYPSPAVCIEPALGAEATRALGRTPPEPIAAHLAVCLACLLERVAFDKLGEAATAPAPEVRTKLRRLLLRRFGTGAP